MDEIRIYDCNFPKGNPTRFFVYPIGESTSKEAFGRSYTAKSLGTNCPETTAKGGRRENSRRTGNVERAGEGTRVGRASERDGRKEEARKRNKTEGKRAGGGRKKNRLANGNLLRILSY